MRPSCPVATASTGQQPNSQHSGCAAYASASPLSARHTSPTPALPCPSPAQQFVESKTQNTLGRQLMYWMYCEANGGYSPASVSAPPGALLYLLDVLPDQRRLLSCTGRWTGRHA